jgi:hypothetical protein
MKATRAFARTHLRMPNQLAQTVTCQSTTVPRRRRARPESTSGSSCVTEECGRDAGEARPQWAGLSWAMVTHSSEIILILESCRSSCLEDVHTGAQRNQHGLFFRTTFPRRPSGLCRNSNVSSRLAGPLAQWGERGLQGSGSGLQVPTRADWTGLRWEYWGVWEMRRWDRAGSLDERIHCDTAALRVDSGWLAIVGRGLSTTA